MDNGLKLTIYFLALAVCLGMNLAALIAMWADKRRAQRGASRVRERTLFLLLVSAALVILELPIIIR